MFKVICLFLIIFILNFQLPAFASNGLAIHHYGSSFYFFYERFSNCRLSLYSPSAVFNGSNSSLSVCFQSLQSQVVNFPFDLSELKEFILQEFGDEVCVTPDWSPLFNACYYLINLLGGGFTALKILHRVFNLS